MATPRFCSSQVRQQRVGMQGFVHLPVACIVGHQQMLCSTQHFLTEPSRARTGAIRCRMLARSRKGSPPLVAGPSLAPELKIDTESPDFARLAFSPAADTVWAATSDNKLERYCCDTGALLTIVDAGHLDEISTLLMHPSGAFLFTGAHDKLLKAWDIGGCVACSGCLS